MYVEFPGDSRVCISNCGQPQVILVEGMQDGRVRGVPGVPGATWVHVGLVVHLSVVCQVVVDGKEVRRVLNKSSRACFVSGYDLAR